MQNSGRFILDRAQPIPVTEENIFVLMGCSSTSPIFDRNADFCNTGSGLNLCKVLYSCKSVNGMGLEPNTPISTCCIYDPTIGLGSKNDLDLPKLQCSTYSGIYGFGGDKGDPMKWQYGIFLQYKDSYFDNGFKNCEDCEGFYGFSGVNKSFACICHNGRISP
ncbi:uncharacterized protein LOC142520240 [Primulina tabacum]|uniref:uncharacterized protein LOC142520240 n=1 Tax=Primulina tabacum TaxID=48773 RepID=UPI003F59DA89